jgi:hypothetical protein
MRKANEASLDTSQFAFGSIEHDRVGAKPSALNEWSGEVATDTDDPEREPSCRVFVHWKPGAQVKRRAV